VSIDESAQQSQFGIAQSNAARTLTVSPHVALSNRVLRHASGFSSSTFFKSGTYIMSDIKQASGFHKQAASDHEAAAKHHLKAAECHDQNKSSDAKGSSKSAMECCNTAQKTSKTACDCSAQ
jgi:hypothetical protein